MAITTKNLIVSSPKVGDILVLDSNNVKKYIALDTYQSSSLPAGYTVVGVVGSRQGNQALIVHKANTLKKWSDVMIWELSDAALTDGASHTDNFTANGVTLEITWNTSSLSAFAAAMNSALNGYDFGGHNFRCVYKSDVDKVYIIHDTYTDSQYPLFLNLTGTIGEDIPMNDTSYRKSGRSVDCGVINLQRAVEYYKTNGSTPTANVPLNISSAEYSPVKLVEFQENAFCADIRNAYCVDPSEPTEADYKNYIAHEVTAEYPSNRASMAEMYRDGKDFTYRLVGKKYLASDNTQKDLYPAAEYCAAVEYDADGLRSGDWFLPSKYQMGRIWSILTYGLSGVSRADADPINRSLNAIGGSAISCTSSAWSSAMYLRGFADLAWNYSNSGYFDFSSFCNSSMCVPCVLLTI